MGTTFGVLARAFRRQTTAGSGSPLDSALGLASMLEPRPRLGFLARFLVAGLVVLVCSTAGSAAFAIGTISQVAADLALGGKPIHSGELHPAADGDPQTILIVGDDHQGNSAEKATGTVDQGTGVPLLHADTFMLVRMDPRQEQTSILSIPRDLMVSFCRVLPDGTVTTDCYSQVRFNTAYAVGGIDTVLAVIKKYLPGITVNHVIDFNFASFLGVIKAIGCVYVDVDQTYYNPGNDSYLAIDLAPGYHRLCGTRALAYVRYRHTDSDFVRVARQADFIRQAKEQVGVGGLLSKYNQIASAFGRAIKTDIRGYHDIYQLLNLAAYSTSQPVRHVDFQVSNASYFFNGQEMVTSTRQLIRSSIYDLLYENPRAAAPPAPPAGKGHHHRPHASLLAPASLAAAHLYPLDAGTIPAALRMSVDVPFKVLLPTVETGSAGFASDLHPYAVFDEQNHLHHGYRVDWAINGNGGYYGIEGLNWTDPPLFANPTATETINGRRYMFVGNGGSYQYIGWREGKVLYWVSNSLLDDLSNRQMLALAESAHPVT
jgi:LCP family protein required for cell wall assembly